jgi:cell pole-organizing protein PopZ
MSAVNTAVNASGSDREHEALRRAQRAHEPSMEEILASIRTIIAEERQPTKASEPQTAAPKAALAAAAHAYSKGEPAETSRFAQPAQRTAPAVEANPPRVAWSEPGALAAEPLKAAVPDDAPLLAPETDIAVASAFEALSSKLAARSSELAEGLTREMLRPMLKAWLDENLPALVERLVRAEIDRIVRGAR